VGSLGGAPHPRKDIKGALWSTHVSQKLTGECQEQISFGPTPLKRIRTFSGKVIDVS